MTFRRAFYIFYRKARQLIAPSLKYSQTVYEEVLLAYTADKANWLDLGCGHQILTEGKTAQERALADRVKLLVGLDLDEPSLAGHRTIQNLVVGDISLLPFVNDSFDLITSNMVFEHLKDPQGQLKEVFRVLKPGGALIFHTPNLVGYQTVVGRLLPSGLKARAVWFLQRREERDLYPTYYRINSNRSIREAALAAGFSVERLRFIATTPQLWLVPPFVIIELLLIRFSLTRLGRPFRTNIIGILTKRNP